MRLRDYIRERNKAVLKGDIDSFKAFLKQALDEKAITKEFYNNFMDANSLTQQATIEKLACEIRQMPVWRKNQAKQWLISHEMTPSVRG